MCDCRKTCVEARFCAFNAARFPERRGCFDEIRATRNTRRGSKLHAERFARTAAGRRADAFGNAFDERFEKNARAGFTEDSKRIPPGKFEQILDILQAL